MNAIYARVSTDAQAETGYSISDQIRTCREHAEKNGLEIVEYIDDGYSGEYLERPALERLRDDLRAKLIHNVIVYDPDRLSRNLTNQLLLADEIEKANAQLIFITHDYDASPEGRLFFSIRGAISAFEKAKIRERTLRGKRSKALSGKLTFNDDAYGYTYDKENSMCIVNPEEAEIVKLIFQLYTTRNYGVNSLYVELKSMGVLNRKGKPFGLATIDYMLANETYAGTKWSFKQYLKNVGPKKRERSIRDKSEWIPITVPAIIDRETWEKSVECRRINKVVAKRNSKHDYLLSSIIRCAGCGYAMRGVNYHRGNKDYRYYVCTAYINGHECDYRKTISSQELDDAVWAELTEAAKSKHGLSIYQNNTTDTTAVKIDLEKQLAKLKKRQSAIVKWVADGILETEAAEKDLQSISKEVAATKNALSALAVIPSVKSISSKDILKATSFEEKRRLLIAYGIKVFAKRENGSIVYTIKV
ncbi:MAG: Resolvase protein [Firmicutes bacterium]|nr:Resolvase protein [Bacillota bacterium]